MKRKKTQIAELAKRIAMLEKIINKKTQTAKKITTKTNGSKRWTNVEIDALMLYTRQGVTDNKIALMLGRTKKAIQMARIKELQRHK